MSLPDGEHDIGRLPDCWLTIDDDLASRQHARFHIAGPTAVLVDLGSRNGTFVNGQRIVGRRTVHDGDKVRVGREILVVVRSDQPIDDDDEGGLRRTLAPGEDTRFPSLIGQLVEKSLRVGKVKEAERYASALTNQLGASPVDVEHPAAKACVSCLLGLAEHTASGVWLDRLFQLHVKQNWVMEIEAVERVRGALDRIPRVPGHALADYEQQLRRLQRAGHGTAGDVLVMVAEIVDAAGQR